MRAGHESDSEGATLVGALPTYETIGTWAPILVVFLRLCQGFGAGAEQAGATVLMAEYAPIERRRFFAALPFIGIQAGTLLAAMVFVYLGTIPEDVLPEWVWRIPFLASILLILVAQLIRLRLRESPTFIVLQKHEAVYTFILASITLATAFLAAQTRGRDLTRIEDARRQAGRICHRS